MSLIRFPLHYNPPPKPRPLLSEILGAIMVVVAIGLWAVVIWMQGD